MLEHLIVILVVAVALWYVVRGLRRSLTGRTACAQESCAGCPFAATCHHPEKTAAPVTTHETEPRSS